MKSMAEASAAWPTLITHMRAICHMLHNTSWRKTIKRLVAQTHPAVDVSVCDHFTANIVKWRYEMVDNVLTQLDKWRPVLELVVPEVFGNVQDRESLEAAMRALRDPIFLPYVSAASRHVFHPTELGRHWGMVCPCPEHIREREEGAKRQRCWRNSRRLRQSWDFVKSQIDDAHAKVTTLTPALCEGNAAIAGILRTHLLVKQSGLRMRCKYLKTVPWAFSRADEIAGAEEVMRQVRSRPLEEHDALTRWLMQRIGGDVDRRAQGEDASPALVLEVYIINLSPLEEGCGESWHRASNLEHIRAPASSSAHLKQEPRFKQEQARILSFMDKHGERGRDVIRYEWGAWKRVLQTQWKSRWTPVRLNPQAALQKILHDDDMGNEDWSLIVNKEVPPRPTQTEDNSGDRGLRTEYLSSVFNRHAFYAYPQRVENIDEDGQPEVHRETTFFEVLHKRDGHSRPHVMPTFETPDEPYLTASLALEIQPMQQVPESIDIAGQIPSLDTPSLFPDAEPYWINVHDIAPFNVLAHDLLTWKTSTVSEDQEGVLVLS